MIILDMINKTEIRITNKMYTLENGILTLEIDPGTYDLTDKVITASFNLTGIETAPLANIDGIIQLPIYSNLVAYGINYIQLNFRWDTDKLEQSGKMMWRIDSSIPTTEVAQEDIDIINFLVNEVTIAVDEADRVVDETGDIKIALDESIVDANLIKGTLDTSTLNANTINNTLSDEVTGTIKQATDINLTLDSNIDEATLLQADIEQAIIDNQIVTQPEFTLHKIDYTTQIALKATQKELNYKLGFLRVASNNLVDHSKIITGGYFGGGGVWTANASFKSTDFIEVIAGESYIKTNTLTASYWDKDFNYISSFITATFIPPVNAKYVRLSYTTIDLMPQLNKGVVLLAYDEYRLVSDTFRASVEPSDVGGFIDTTTSNLFNKNTVTQGSKLDASGVVVADATYAISDYIPIDGWATYIQTNIHLISYYDINKVWLSSGSTPQPFTTPSVNAIKFARINVPLSQLATAMFVRDDTLPSSYLPYYKKDLDNADFLLKNYVKSKLYGKKWNAYGDSITVRGYAYHSVINTDVGGMIVRNYGLSGRSLASRGATSDASYPPAVLDYVNMDNDADIITVFVGTNDYSSGVVMGAVDSTVITEFNGALNVLMLGLINKYVGKKIAFITPIQRRVDSGLITYVNAIKAAGTRFGIPVLDLFSNCGLYPKADAINNVYFESADGLHPNLKGHKILAPRIQTFLESL